MEEVWFNFAWRCACALRIILKPAQAKKQSVETVGILKNLRKGPWIISSHPHNAIVPGGKYTNLHWGTLIDGAKAAFAADPQKLNKVLQGAISEGLDDCTVFSNKTPFIVKQWLTALGNRGNKDSKATTFVEVYRTVPVIQAAWARKCKAMGWSVESIGQAEYERRKWILADSLYKKSFDNKGHLEARAVLT